MRETSLRDDLITGVWSQRNATVAGLNNLDAGYRLAVSDQT